MPLLHMQTEEVRGTGRLLRQTAATIQTEAQNLSTAVNNLATQWQGPSSNQFRSQIEPLLQQLMRVSEKGSELDARVQREVDQWEQTDAGLSSNQKNNGIGNPGVLEGIRDIFVPFFPYDISEGINYLEDQPAGEDLIELARENGITFQLPNGEFVGYQGDDGEVVVIEFGDSIGGGTYIDDKITISNGILNRVRSKEELASVLAHEMQHAIDDNTGLRHDSINTDELAGYFEQSPETQQSIRERLANDLETNYLDSEIRAYQRGEAVKNGTEYQDDGVMTRQERQEILDKNINSKMDYEDHYENSLADIYPDAEFDVWLDDQGELYVDIQPSTPHEEDDWWPLW